jgi:NAD(P)-dependent dehydrogenase (short-subunit alcohol dehydrogenase family)
MTEPYPFPTSADEFADKRVLVTGGTRGIGAAVVRRFQLAGARVVATARSAPAHAVDGVLFIPADIGTARDRLGWRLLRDGLAADGEAFPGGRAGVDRLLGGLAQRCVHLEPANIRAWPPELKLDDCWRTYDCSGMRSAL